MVLASIENNLHNPMFPKIHRLSKNRDIKKVFEKGRNFFTPLFILRFLPRVEGVSRFTVVVSVKVSKSAVRRNRIKRIVRENLKKRAKDLKIGDYMVSLKPKAGTIPESFLLNSITNFFKYEKAINLFY